MVRQLLGKSSSFLKTNHLFNKPAIFVYYNGSVLKKFYKFFFFFLLFASSFVLKAQEDEMLAEPILEEEAPPAPKHYYFLSPRISVTVPHPMANASFKKSFVGIYEISSGLNIYVIKGAFLGVTYKNGLLKITENKIADYNARMTINNAAVKIGGDLYVGDRNRVIYSFAVSGGRNWTRYSGLVSKDPAKVIPSTYSCSYLEPEMNLFFLIESNFGIGLTVSYSIFDKTFDPYELSLNDWTQFSKKNSGSTQYVSFGFGFYYSLIRKQGPNRGY
jgi:hypothetical protein